ncbi:MAG: hypothetical protein EOP05_00340 [Proteobacteria bacterium]|nr:MAG: hypothetical protein EOP05_00340 [Pseudomonadota bacterium]
MQAISIDGIVSRNRAEFIAQIKSASTVQKLERRVRLYQQAFLFARDNPCGIFNSKKVEDDLAALCLQVPTAGKDVGVKFQNLELRGTLHVLTRAYMTGGHTRVVERWIAASNSEPHSVVLISQGGRPVPQKLTEAVEASGGTIFILDEVLSLQKASVLRGIGQSHQKVIIHSHTYDVVPTLAFSGACFAKPVFIYNHADHLPWIGCAVADGVINFRKAGAQLTRERRGISNTIFLPLPISKLAPLARDVESRQAAKARLGFPDAQIILTMASGYKYEPVGDLNFQKMTLKVLDLNPKAVLFVIGPNPDDKIWTKAIEKSSGRLMVKGRIPFSDLQDVLSAADLTIDSYPLGSTTALLDLASLGIPALALNLASNTYDAFERAQIYCDTQQSLIEHATLILQSPLKGEAKGSALAELIRAESSPSGFSKRLEAVSPSLLITQKNHRVVQDSEQPLSAFELSIAQSLISNSRGLRPRLIRLSRRLARFYIAYFFPYFLPKRTLKKLDSYGII